MQHQSPKPSDGLAAINGSWWGDQAREGRQGVKGGVVVVETAGGNSSDEEAINPPWGSWMAHLKWQEGDGSLAEDEGSVC